MKYFSYILHILSHTNGYGGEFNDQYEIHQTHGQSAPNFPLGKYHILISWHLHEIRLLAESGFAGRKKASISIYDLSIINQFQSIVEQADDSTTKSSKQLELISFWHDGQGGEIFDAFATFCHLSAK